MSLLKTRGLSRHFGGLKAVDDVDFDLGQGEIRAIIGPNGAGKSTFVSLLSGRYKASAGTVEFLGQDVSSLPAFRRVRLGIAYTFQITNIYTAMTVLENVSVAAQSRLKPNIFGHRHVTEATIEEEAAKAAATLGLGDMLDVVAGTLAYGHQRLLEVAMGLALEPKLLILDEPTQGLSDSEIENFKDVVRKINETATVLLIEHNMDVVMSLAERITVLDRGQILAEGTPAEISDNRAVQAAYLGEAAE
ncbi:ABC transporter ATP-binding protein [Chachezhania antarctica]|uniref:ABC transporter ATP-binding protein n=1 Tax=Chachezhania antarctica TaxID=2340860 RepID=UPI0019698EB3|nr:ABC transporter ATP-binding protein [Chachezhania antarctica]